MKPDSQPPMFGCHASGAPPPRPPPPPPPPSRAASVRTAAPGDDRAPPPPAAPPAAAAAATAAPASRRGRGSMLPLGRQPLPVTRHRRIARPAHRAVVLPVAVDPVRHPVVDGDVIHLADRQRHAELAVLRVLIARAAVAGQHPVRRRSSDRSRCRDSRRSRRPHRASERHAAISRSMEAAVHHEHFVGVLRIDVDADVVAGAADERAIPTHHPPRRARVVRSPQRSLVRRLDQRVHPLRRSTARSRRRSCRRADFGRPAVRFFHVVPPSCRHVDAAAGAAAEHRPRVQVDLPRAGDQDVGIRTRPSRGPTARVGIDEEHRCHVAPPSVVL